MSKNILFIIVGLLIIGGAGYFILNRSLNQPVQQTPSPTEQATPTPPQEYTLTISEQNDSSESGTAILTEENGQVKVVLNLIGAPEGVTQPAHIHLGSCPDVGAVKYALTSPVNGMAETMLDVTLEQLRSELPLGINVHKSENEAKIYVSCGDLVL